MVWRVRVIGVVFGVEVRVGGFPVLGIVGSGGVTPEDEDWDDDDCEYVEEEEEALLLDLVFRLDGLWAARGIGGAVVCVCGMNVRRDSGRR